MSSLSATIQEMFNEPGCAKNANKSDAERKKGCTKQLQPGGAAGGCAFDGAKIALQPLPTSPIWCTVRSPARVIPGTTAVRLRLAPASGGPASPLT
ncbi:hypothetical protein ACF1BQ_032190 [Bradyrhizobium sp. RDT10]